jgi:hypothetical protein
MELFGRRKEISGVLTEHSAWRGAVDGKRAQVDLAVSRNDGIVKLYEMKYTQEEFSVDRAYDEQLRRKLSVFRKSTKTRSAVHLTLVTTYGLERNTYAGAFQSVVTAEDLFKVS